MLPYSWVYEYKVCEELVRAFVLYCATILPFKSQIFGGRGQVNLRVLVFPFAKSDSLIMSSHAIHKVGSCPCASELALFVRVTISLTPIFNAISTIVLTTTGETSTPSASKVSIITERSVRYKEPAPTPAVSQGKIGLRTTAPLSTVSITFLSLSFSFKVLRKS